MKNLTLIFVGIISSFLLPQNITNTPITPSTPIGNTKVVEIKSDSLLTSIKEDIDLAIKEKENLKTKLDRNKALAHERSIRINNILDKIKQREKTIPKVKEKIVKITTPERYTMKKDSICIRTIVFSNKCTKWDTFYVVTDKKNKDTLILKNKN